jgi:UPF0755 protein
MTRFAVVGGRRRGGAVGTILWLIVLAGLAAGAFGAWWVLRETTGPGPLKTEAVVMLEPGTSVSGIAAQLEKAGAIRDKRLFVAAVRAHNMQSKLKAGEYAIPAGASVVDIIKLLVEGKSILHQVTAPEGRTTAQILRIIAEDPALVGEITLDPKEGELLPETYSFTRGLTRDEMIRMMMTARNKLLDEVWDGRATDLPFNTRDEAVTLASIVEKETGVADERPRIAGVFVNRLKKRMRLESDPTVIYGLTKGEPLGRGLRQSELRRETPYNTYVIFGLPPTPIANPGRAAIEAVLNPMETDEIFFVADGTGGHAFATTLAEHNRNVAKWRKIEADQ